MTEFVWREKQGKRRASPAVREPSPGTKPDRKSHKPRPPNRCALMPVGLSRHPKLRAMALSETSEVFCGP